MKKLLSLLLLTVICYALPAQTFEHNLDQSLAKAKTENKNILMIFSGSDWCKNCIVLRKTVIDSEKFITFSNEKLVLLELDFPYKKANKLSKEQTAHNEKLAEQYNKKGSFPAMVLLDAEQNLLGSVYYTKNMTPQELIDQINNLTAQ